MLDFIVTVFVFLILFLATFCIITILLDYTEEYDRWDDEDNDEEGTR